MQNLAQYGYDVILPVNTMGTLAIVGVCFGVWIKAKKQEILSFVQQLKLTEKPIVTYRAIYGLPWARVAAKMGYRYTEQAVKKKYYRILKKYF